MDRIRTAAFVDGLLRATACTGLLFVGVAAPNAVQAFDKPLRKLFKDLDKRARIRETKRVIRYMKQQGLLRGDYEHGLQITEKGRQRIQRRESNIDYIIIPIPDTWDKRWRIVFYDIPEMHKVGRNALAKKMRQKGFWQLQRSVWVYPYPCKDEIKAIALYYKVDKFITYLESDYIDNQKILIDRFKAKNIM